MGVDLQAMASYFREWEGELLPTATVRFERDPALFRLLSTASKPCLARPLPAGLKVGCYEDDGLRFTAVDRGGQPLTFTTPPDLRALTPPPDLSPWNRAVLVFLLALPDDTRIVLYWC
jgi:hypothetical protein